MSKNKNLIIPTSQAEKATAERLAIRLKGSIGTLQGVLRHAKKEHVSIPDACRKLGRHPNYVNTAFHFLNKAEKENGIRLPEVMELERMRTSINSVLGTRRGPKPFSKKSTPVVANSSRKGGSGIENAIAGMRHAVENKMSMFDASGAIGKSSSFLSMCVSTVDGMKASEQQKETLRDLHAEYKQLVANGEIRLKIGQKKVVSTSRNRATNIILENKSTESKNINVLMNISDSGNVEYKYPLVTDRPLRKIQKTYPLEAMRPGHSFSVPATKGEVKAVKKAVTMFAKNNPDARFVQAKEGRELVIWRTE